MTDADRIASLERRLRLLEDKDEIRALRDAYHSCINDGRYHVIVDLFTEDAVVELGYLARYEGREAIDAGFRGMGERERFYIKQFIHTDPATVSCVVALIAATAFVERIAGISIIGNAAKPGLFTRIKRFWCSAVFTESADQTLCEDCLYRRRDQVGLQSHIDQAHGSTDGIVCMQS